jgi:hypothetical protein
MQSSMARIVLAFAVGAALVFAVLKFGPNLGRPVERLVRTYQVPASLQSRLESSLGAALAGQGTVVRGPDGYLVVTTPESIQVEIPKLLASLTGAAPDAAMIQFDVWVVSKGTGVPLDDPRFAPIHDALAKATDAGSGERFELQSRTSLRTASGDGGRSGDVRVRHPELRKRADGSSVIIADLSLESGSLRNSGTPLSALETRLVMTPGDTVVVEQTVQVDKGRTETIYRIVHASL